MNDDRLVEIEIKLAHQEDTVAQLNAVVSQQEQRIDHLETRCRVLAEQLQGLSSGTSADAPAGEVPPHY